VERKLEVIRHLPESGVDNNEVGNKVVGSLLWLVPLLFPDRGRGGRDRDDDRDDSRGRGRGRGDDPEVGEDNNVVLHRSVVSPLVRAGDNEEVHISVVIDHFHSLHLCSHPLVHVDNNVEEHKSEVIDPLHPIPIP
jgi:hypothetical protein